MQKSFLTFLMLVVCLCTNFSSATSNPYSIEIEETLMPGTPAIHSFAFAQSGGKWLFIGGRTNGLHGFTPATAFPKQFSNKNIFVVDPVSMQTWSRNIFLDLPFTVTDQFRSSNMESVQIGNKLYIVGGYGYDSTVNSLKTFSLLSVIDVNEIIQAVINGNSIAPFVRQITDSRMQVTGGELEKLGDYFYLTGGHIFTGGYRRTVNNQIYTDQIRKFKINDNGINISISDYSAFTDTTEYHRRDLNLVPALKDNGSTEYLIMYGGVFKRNIDLPYLNPIYIDDNSITVDYGYQQIMNQYTTAFMSAYNSSAGKMHTTFFGGMSLHSFNEITQSLEYDSLVPFIDDITTLTRNQDGTSGEIISTEKMPALLGTNAKFILSDSIPKYSNDVIKLDQITGRTLAGYVYGGIRALLPNNGASFPSEYILKVYITPDVPLPVELVSFNSSVSNSNVILNWITSSEQNNSGFEIERKISDRENNDWIKTGFVNGSGNSNVQNTYSFEDRNLSTGKYEYRLKQIDFNGNFSYFSLEDAVKIGIPDRFSLSQNYPNPFNPTTIINFQISKGNNVTLKIYNSSGSEIATLVNEFKEAGYYTYEFSASGNLASGVYYYKLNSGEFEDVKRMVLLK